MSGKTWLLGFLLVVTMIFAFGEAQSAQHHAVTDQAKVIRSNLYLGNQATGLSAPSRVQGDIILFDGRNSFNYSYIPGCTFWKVGDLVQLTISYDDWVHSTQISGYQLSISDAPTGCNSVSNGGNP